MAVLLLGSLVACDELSSGGGSTHSSSAGATRIVSLTPAITQMLIDMGKRENIVGVSRDDHALDLPVCGTYNDPLIAKILELDPDVVLTESATRDNSDVPQMLRSLANEGVFKLEVVHHSLSIADVERTLTDAQSGLGAAIGDAAAAERARRLMAMRMELVRASVQNATPQRVLMLINPMTLGAIGSGVTHDELLRQAGGINAAGIYNTGYITLTRAQVQQDVRPDVILILEPGGRPLLPDDARLRALEGLSVPAVYNKRIVVIDHPSVMLPSTRLPEVLVEIASAIHPDREGAIREAYAAAEVAIDRADRASEKGNP